MHQRVRFPSNSSVAVREHEATGHRAADALQSQIKSTGQNWKAISYGAEPAHRLRIVATSELLATSEATQIADSLRSRWRLTAGLACCSGARGPDGDVGSATSLEGRGATLGISFPRTTTAFRCRRPHFRTAVLARLGMALDLEDGDLATPNGLNGLAAERLRALRSCKLPPSGLCPIGRAPDRFRACRYRRPSTPVGCSESRSIPDS